MTAAPPSDGTTEVHFNALHIFKIKISADPAAEGSSITQTTQQQHHDTQMDHL